MSAEEIGRRAQQLQARARLTVIFSIVLGSLLCIFFAWGCAREPALVPRLGRALLSLWSAWFAYQQYRWIWPGHLEPDGTTSHSLEFYRKELERRRDYGRHIWRRAGLTFCFLGVGMVIWPGLVQSAGNPRLLGKMVPFFAVLAVWVVIFLFTKNRNRQKLQREIDELQGIERQG